MSNRYRTSPSSPSSGAPARYRSLSPRERLPVVLAPNTMVIGDPITTERWPDEGPGQAELEVMRRNVLAHMAIPVEAPPASAAPDRSPFVRIDTLTEAMGLALADTETRATEALQELRDELLARMAEIERRGG